MKESPSLNQSYQHIKTLHFQFHQTAMGFVLEPGMGHMMVHLRELGWVLQTETQLVLLLASVLAYVMAI
jgi:hypothetical protein